MGMNISIGRFGPANLVIAAIALSACIDSNTRANRPGESPEETDAYLAEEIITPEQEQIIKVKGNIIRIPTGFTQAPVLVRAQRYEITTEDADAQVLLGYGENVVKVEVLDASSRQILTSADILESFSVEQTVEASSDANYYALSIAKEEDGTRVREVQFAEVVTASDDTSSLALQFKTGSVAKFRKPDIAFTIQAFEEFPAEFYDEQKVGPVTTRKRNATGGTTSSSGESDSDPARDDQSGASSKSLDASDSRFRLQLISVGGAHTCTIVNEGRVESPGSVYCFGSNYNGQLGNASGRSSCDVNNVCDQEMIRVTLPAGDRAISVSNGESHSCALTQTGNVACWGGNDYGQLGVGDTVARNGASLSIVEFPQNQRIVAISAALSHTCALTGTGKVYCWGDNSQGQLGVGGIPKDCFDADGACGPSNYPEVLPPAGRTFVGLGKFGGNHQCGILDDRSILCWGDNAQGQLGIGSVTDPCSPLGNSDPDCARDAAPITLPGGSASQVAGGTGFSCALSELGEVFCWGSSDAGQLGLPSVSSKCDSGGPTACLNSLQKIRFQGEAKAVSISAGANHACAEMESGGYICWGSRALGIAGDGASNGSRCGPSDTSCLTETPKLAFPVELQAGELSAGSEATCSVMNDKSLICWGKGAWGQLGVNNAANRCDSGGPSCLSGLTPALLPYP
jgi:alpha-tubulin suppressor-like RCC1 family protein